MTQQEESRKLLRELESDHFLDRSEALHKLADFAAESRVVVRAIIAALADSDPWVRGAAADALGEVEPPLIEAVPLLIAALRDPDGWVRECAAEALTNMKPPSPEVVEALTNALSDPRISDKAMEALAEIGPAAKSSVPGLIGALGKDDKFSDKAAEALGQIGEEAHEAIPALNRPVHALQAITIMASFSRVSGRRSKSP